MARASYLWARAACHSVLPAAPWVTRKSKHLGPPPSLPMALAQLTMPGACTSKP